MVSLHISLLVDSHQHSPFIHSFAGFFQRHLQNVDHILIGFVVRFMVAFATTVGVGVMVDSFRGGVAIWINDLLNADLYIAPPAIEDGGSSETVRPAALAALRETPGVAAVSTYRRLTMDLDGHPIQVMAVDLAPGFSAARPVRPGVIGWPARPWRCLLAAGSGRA